MKEKVAEWLCFGATAAAGLILVAQICRASVPSDSASLEIGLAQQVDHLVAAHYELIGSGVIRAMPKGKHAVVPVQLEGGANYAMLAVCGQSCSHVEIQLFDATGTYVHGSPEASDVVVVGGQPPENGLYQVLMIAPGCGDDTCDIAFAVMKQGEAKGAVDRTNAPPKADLRSVHPAPPADQSPSAPAEAQQVISELANLGVTVQDVFRARQRAVSAPSAPLHTDLRAAPGSPAGYAAPPPARNEQPQPQRGSTGKESKVAQPKSRANCEQVKQQYLAAVQQVGPIGSAQPAINLYAYLQCNCGYPPSPHVTSCPR